MIKSDLFKIDLAMQTAFWIKSMPTARTSSQLILIESHQTATDTAHNRPIIFIAGGKTMVLQCIMALITGIVSLTARAFHCCHVN